MLKVVQSETKDCWQASRNGLASIVGACTTGLFSDVSSFQSRDGLMDLDDISCPVLGTDGKPRGTSMMGCVLWVARRAELFLVSQCP